jgi:hypothetical protein
VVGESVEFVAGELNQSVMGFNVEGLLCLYPCVVFDDLGEDGVLLHKFQKEIMEDVFGDKGVEIKIS